LIQGECARPFFAGLDCLLRSSDEMLGSVEKVTGGVSFCTGIVPANQRYQPCTRLQLLVLGGMAHSAIYLAHTVTRLTAWLL
jgi:hypothetical protein